MQEYPMMKTETKLTDISMIKGGDYMLTLWNLILLLNDGLCYVFNKDEKLIDIFTIGFTDNIEDLDGHGQRIIDKFERRVTEDNETHFLVFLSDEIDENEHGQIQVF